MMSIYRNIMRARRQKAAKRQFPVAVLLFKNALKAGLSVSGALKFMSEELRGPLGEEFERIVMDIRNGLSVDEALDKFSERLPNDDVVLFVQSVQVLRRTGGNIVETAESLYKTIEERDRVEDKIRTITSQGRIQCIILIAMPWLIALSLYLISPDYIIPMFRERLGLFFMVLTILIELIGAMWMKKIINVYV